MQCVLGARPELLITATRIRRAVLLRIGHASIVNLEHGARLTLQTMSLNRRNSQNGIGTKMRNTILTLTILASVPLFAQPVAAQCCENNGGIKQCVYQEPGYTTRDKANGILLCADGLASRCGCMIEPLVPEQPESTGYTPPKEKEAPPVIYTPDGGRITIER